MSRAPAPVVILTAILTLLLVLIAGQALLQPTRPLITHAEFSHTAISPNADGEDDVALFAYGLSRNARISLTFASITDGARYVFREDELRVADDYEVAFGGVVDGYTRPGEEIAGEVLRRLLPDGAYTWRLRASDRETGTSDQREGRLRIHDADTPLPQISSLTVWPSVFTPNRDGISDRSEINVFLEKESRLQVWLAGREGERLFISPRHESRRPGEAGRHSFDYEGGIDLGAEPPPDGVYEVLARAEDDEGQVVMRRAQLELRAGGKPLAEIVPQAVGVDVVFAVRPWEERYLSVAGALGAPIALPGGVQDNRQTTITLPLGEVLVFRLTVWNYSEVPLRTTGPPPGTVYQQDQRAATLDAFDESGAWRVGIDCTTAESDYPWRWALGADEELVEVFDEASGNTYRYLPPGRQVVIWGGIRFTKTELRNPQNCWAGLIHEDVEISIRNNHVGPREIELVE